MIKKTLAVLLATTMTTPAFAQVAPVKKPQVKRPAVEVPQQVQRPQVKINRPVLSREQVQRASKPIQWGQWRYMPARYSPGNDLQIVLTGSNLGGVEVVGVMLEPVDGCVGKCEAVWRSLVRGLAESDFVGRDSGKWATVRPGATVEYTDDPAVDCDRYRRAALGGGRIAPYAQSKLDNLCHQVTPDFVSWSDSGLLRAPVLVKYRVNGGSVQTKRLNAGGEMVVDADGDGVDTIAFGRGTDCDDNDANRFPGNAEVDDPDGHDEDCDFRTFGNTDRDGDGFISAAAWNDDGSKDPPRGRDCDDGNPGIHPNMGEIPNNGLDDNCDGDVDWDESWPPKMRPAGT